MPSASASAGGDGDEDGNRNGPESQDARADQPANGVPGEVATYRQRGAGLQPGGGR